MSAQCWCYTCAGRLVSRNTFANHGRKFRPDEPLRKKPCLPLVSMDNDDADVDVDHLDYETPSDSSDDEQMDEHDPLGLQEECEDEARIGRGGMSPQGIILWLLDWMSSHKVTDSCASDMWKLVTALAPENIEMKTWDQIKGVLRKQEKKSFVRIEICPNDCIAYWDSKHLPESENYKNSHRTKCPVCFLERWVTDPVDGTTRPAKVITHFPIGNYIKSLFARDLAEHLFLDCAERPEGHTARSRAFKRKIFDNPAMNGDHRNVALVGTTDGVPLFDDQRRGAWPFIFRCANLPDSLSFHPSNTHLSLISASEYWELEPSTNRLKRRIRAPKSSKHYMAIIIDDLLHAYHKGVLCVDSSIPEGKPGRSFRCKVMLLFWTGDYPAQALVSGTHSKMCHWCNDKAVRTNEISRGCWCRYKRFLGNNAHHVDICLCPVHIM